MYISCSCLQYFITLTTIGFILNIKNLARYWASETIVVAHLLAIAAVWARPVTHACNMLAWWDESITSNNPTSLTDNRYQLHALCRQCDIQHPDETGLCKAQNRRPLREIEDYKLSVPHCPSKSAWPESHSFVGSCKVGFWYSEDQIYCLLLGNARAERRKMTPFPKHSFWWQRLSIQPVCHCQKPNQYK